MQLNYSAVSLKNKFTTNKCEKSHYTCLYHCLENAKENIGIFLVLGLRQTLLHRRRHALVLIQHLKYAEVST